jgi:hypothetical protein
VSGRGDLAIAVSAERIRRGQRLDVRLELPEDLGEEPVEVALACTVRYDVYGWFTHQSGERSRSTQTDVAWRSQELVSPGQRVQSIAFEIPGNVPYSHQGKALSFAWAVTARQQVRWGRDREATEPVRVLP